MMYGLLADFVLIFHFGIAAFIVAGVVAILVGNWRGWHWVNRLGFRLAHLAAILFVVAESWLGIACPLTTFEMWLRQEAGLPVHGGSFIGHWLQQGLYFTAPAWVFTVVYTVFALLVILTWVRFPPRRRP